MAQEKDDAWLRIWEQIDNANLVPEHDQRKQEIESAISELRQLLESGQKWTLYPLGYAYYCHPDRQPGSPMSSQVDSFLRLAISENVEPELARLYLAFQRYDEKRFEESRDLVGQVPLENLHENIAIRCAELQLCNHLWIGPQAEYPARLFDFATYIASLSEPAIEPLLLMSLLEHLAERNALTDCQAALVELDRAYPILSGHWFRDVVCR
ncbi:hypothetical protein AB1K70_10090 [Bremerella sp. JC770]|uniref:hypothetical protein n=1 Tax=Bremerella sp. JC770 TaxID=3232137 RepID=UPI00345A76F8